MYMIIIIIICFDVGYDGPHMVMQCANIKSALELQHIIDNKIKKERYNALQAPSCHHPFQVVVVFGVLRPVNHYGYLRALHILSIHNIC